MSLELYREDHKIASLLLDPEEIEYHSAMQRKLRHFPDGDYKLKDSSGNEWHVCINRKSLKMADV